MSDTLHFEAHAARRASNRSDGCVHIRGSQVGLFRFRNLLELRPVDDADLVLVRLAAALPDARRFPQQHCRGRRFADKCETAIRINGNNDRNRQPGLLALGRRVESLAELHDVDALLAQRRPYRRTGVGLPRRNLKLDISLYFLCHLYRSSLGTSAWQAPLCILSVSTALSSAAASLCGFVVRPSRPG